MTSSVYIHIPFCNSICSYCAFTKLLSNSKNIDDYLIALEKEIKSKYQGEIIKTLYIGGGTPSVLNLEQLKKLSKIIKLFNFSEKIEFTFEVNPESIDLEKIIRKTKRR